MAPWRVVAAERIGGSRGLGSLHTSGPVRNQLE